MNRLLLKPGASPIGDGSTSSPRARQADGACPEQVEGCELQKRSNIFFKKMMYLLPIPMFIVAVNYFVEKTNLLKNNARDAAHYLWQGYNIANAYTCGDSCIKEFYVKNEESASFDTFCSARLHKTLRTSGLKRPARGECAQSARIEPSPVGRRAEPHGKDILVFGSSRSLGINSKLFPGKTFFNMSVTDGRLENFIDFYFLWREKGLIPAHVILGLDVWLLKHKSQDDLMAIVKDKLIEVDSDIIGDCDDGRLLLKTDASPTGDGSTSSPRARRPNGSRPAVPAEAISSGGWEPVEGCEFQKMSSYKQTAGETFEFAQRLGSIDLFRNSLMYVVNLVLHSLGFKGIGGFYPTKENFADVEVMLADGSINYGLVRRTRSVEEVNRQVLSGIKEKGFSHLNDFEKLDVDMVKLFEAFIKLLLRDNVSITFFLTPYHPKAYELLKVSEKNEIVRTVRDYFKDVARKNGIKVLGDFDPAINNLEDSDFFDEFHPKESAMQKVFELSC
ncbi:MAG: hypothetical protein V1646_03500 [bacterium]